MFLESLFLDLLLYHQVLTFYLLILPFQLFLLLFLKQLLFIDAITFLVKQSVIILLVLFFFLLPLGFLPILFLLHLCLRMKNSALLSLRIFENSKIHFVSPYCWSDLKFFYSPVSYWNNPHKLDSYCGSVD